MFFCIFFFFFFNDTATTEIYTLSLHDALPILGILIDGRIHPAAARFVDEMQGLDALAPIATADNLMMRHLCWQAAALADRNGFSYAVDNVRGLIAHVRDVDAAEASGDLRKLGD